MPATRLLVSIVSADEIAAALAGGADIVDVKNPAEGALGAPAPSLLRAARERVCAPALLSVALGDAPHLPGTLAFAAAGAAACGADYVKVGLRGSDEPQSALEMLRALVSAVGTTARVIAVTYADGAGLPPLELPRVAAEAGVHGVMLDTLEKHGTSTFAALGAAAVAAFVDDARERGLVTALAGSLGSDGLARACRLGVDFVGVRGAACDGGRDGVVSPARVRALRTALDLSAAESLAFGRP